MHQRNHIANAPGATTSPTRRNHLSQCPGATTVSAPDGEPFHRHDFAVQLLGATTFAPRGSTYTQSAEGLPDLGVHLLAGGEVY